MQELYKLLIGIIVVLLGLPIGSIISRLTKEELKSGQKWFKLIIIFSLISAIISLIFQQDVLLFTFLFISVVTTRNLI